MTNYLLNNVIQIKKYENYYKYNFDIDKIKQDICTNKIDMNLVDLFRFRIFLDSCVMLFNKEKLEKDYLKDTFDSKNYIASIKNKYGETIKEIEDRFKITVDDTFYYEFNESELKYKPKSLWDSRKILRNSFAHMQYGCFMSYGENGPIPYYFAFNKDKGILKSKGLVIEPLCHELIGKLYLNQMTKSIAYKHTYIKLSEEIPYFMEVKYKGKRKYTLDNQLHPMNNKVFSSGEFQALKEFLVNNEDCFEITKTEITEKELTKYCEMLHKYLGKDITKNELGYFVKSIYDIETEFSNFLTHLIQLNDRIIDYKIAIDSKKAKMIDRILKSIDELKEDSDSWIEFRWFFKIIYIINFSLRLEDTDLESIKYSVLNVDDFEYDSSQMALFVKKKISDGTIRSRDEKFGNTIYILHKIRNAIAHGRIKLEVIDNKVYYVFEDCYYKRTELIKIAVENMNQFINNVNALIK
ncbi:hypothetical protein [Gardnerella pickettii]|uniref:hypothetical protein n=1 Tax=Gardnerella pickettii TaxID=2914924 RepID=UPI000763D4A3|nr:hypothetical protein [Gardnerella pickettii]MDF2278263.1 hypothetical protein [Gardnerella pickettii]